jgi:hypothetical protein
MRYLVLAAFAAALVTFPALAAAPRKIAAAQAEPPASPGEQCRTAIDAAERAQGLPSRLLAAIGQVESGRRDPATGQWTPWPWTIDVGGQGTFFATKAEAIAAVRALQAKGVQSIDVGCVQINLAQHPNAFRSLDDAFDPDINARYGATFLSRLFAMTKDWTKAAAFYHSATPALGAAYEQRVLAALSGQRGPALFATAKLAPQPPQPLQLLPSPEQQLTSAWAATLVHGTAWPETTPAAFTASLAARSPPSRAGLRKASPLFARNVIWMSTEPGLLR